MIIKKAMLFLVFIVILTACGMSEQKTKLDTPQVEEKKNLPPKKAEAGVIDDLIAFQQDVRSVIEEELVKQYPTKHPDSGETEVDNEALLEDLVWYWDNDNKKVIFKVYHENSPKWKEARKHIEERLGEMVVIKQATKNLKMLKDLVEPVTDFLKTKNIKKDMSVSWSPIEEKVIVKVDDLTQELENEISSKFGSDNVTVEEMPDRNAQDT
ncbi:hypothetical protein [Paenibacillus sp. LHD-38]|uniref:hypothetical protein n=1 Tax=Paenibacillus sp. LHD-38 TaxID=3072143 RepID=UPI00280E1B89|nr:hypothetical protein [Paenibacillus sp. LHD-38]MDQ8734223.1 hypothetical protein [Paenibacillus sp. LHD-38]